MEHAESHEILVLETDSCERETLRTILESTGYKVICVSDEVELLKIAQQINPAFIVLDVTLRGAGGLSILGDLKDCGARVIVTSENGDIPTAVQAIKAGAQDFIQKPFCAEKIVHELEQFRKGLAGPVSKRPKPLPFYFPGSSPLTRRERDVFGKLVSGFSSREIALALRISHRTVDDHRGKIMRKFGVRNTTQLMIAVLKSGDKPCSSGRSTPTERTRKNR